MVVHIHDYLVFPKIRKQSVNIKKLTPMDENDIRSNLLNCIHKRFIKPKELG